MSNTNIIYGYHFEIQQKYHDPQLVMIDGSLGGHLSELSKHEDTECPNSALIKKHRENHVQVMAGGEKDICQHKSLMS